jgi:quinate dehydrogenase
MDTLRESFHYGTSPLTSSSLSSPYNTYLFGSHISKSLSPLLHEILFRSLGAPWKFHLEQTTDKQKFQTTLAAPETIGVSITMPNKVTFGLLLDDLTEAAQVIGAVNTTFVRLDSTGKRRYIGTNTDCVGIRESIVQYDPTAIKTAEGKPAMVIGGGGAARSAIYALWKWFSSEIYIVNRLKSEVDDIIKHFTKVMPGIQLRYISDIATAQSLPAPSIIVSTIPDYPPSEAGEVLCWNICETFLEKVDKGLLVDMCYMPVPGTRLVKAANKAGWRTILGTEVLVRVCVAQEALWTERLPNQQGVSEAIAAITQPKNATKL